MKTVIRFFILVLSIFTVSSFSLFAEYDITTETDVSWLNGTITITAAAAVPESTKNLTSERFRITESIDRNLTSYVMEAFDTIYLDSLHSLSEGFTSTQERLTAFDTMNLSKTRISSSMSIDLDTVSNIYKYNIYEELVPLLIEHDQPGPVPVILNYEPTANFSGIIIYASEKLPYYGESEEGPLNPSIFPRIFDRQMELVASASMADPEYLKQWGFILYVNELDERKYEDRIGLSPFYTTAEAVFGNNHTDILIPEKAARKILYNEANHRLIREGRIVVIIDKSEESAE